MMSKKESAEQTEDQEQKQEIEQLLLLPSDQPQNKKLYIVLEQTPIQSALIQSKPCLLNSDDHKFYISKKLKQDPAKFRPDILHHCLLTLMDSPLNKAGFLKVLIKTDQNVLIDISPNTKIPRTYKRFEGLFAQLLKKLKIRAEQTSETLLKIIKNPVIAHLPPEALRIGTSTKARFDFAERLKKNQPICFVIGAVAHGNPGMENDYVHESICISKYSLSAATCLQRILCTFEDLWEI